MPRLRLGAAAIVLRDYFPQIFQNLRKKFPGLKLTLREDYQAGLENHLRRGEIDLAITLLENKSGAGIQSMPLAELPLVLLAPKESKITEAGQLWRRDKITETLICLPAEEMVSRNFQQGLAKLGVDWFPGIETSALDLIATYVAAGLAWAFRWRFRRWISPANPCRFRCRIFRRWWSARSGAASPNLASSLSG